MVQFYSRYHNGLERRSSNINYFKSETFLCCIYLSLCNTKWSGVGWIQWKCKKKVLFSCSNFKWACKLFAQPCSPPTRLFQISFKKIKLYVARSVPSWHGQNWTLDKSRVLTHSVQRGLNVAYYYVRPEQKPTKCHLFFIRIKMSFLNFFFKKKLNFF